MNDSGILSLLSGISFITAVFSQDGRTCNSLALFSTMCSISAMLLYFNKIDI